MDEDCLAVLHNIGHRGRIVNPSRNREELHLSQSHVFVRNTSPIQDPMIDFNRLRHRIFDPSPSNVLILLDCCHAATGSMEQRHDLIAASRFVDVDTHYEPQGFTENVVQQLEHAYNQGEILSTLKLYNRLATRHFVMKNGAPELAAMPISPQHHGSHYLPIFVLPVRPDDNQSWHLAPSVELRLQTVNVIFSVNLNSTDIQNWVLCKVGAAAAYME